MRAIRILFINLMVLIGVYSVSYFFWYLAIKYNFTLIGLLQLFVDIFGFPFLLLGINYRISKKNKQKSFIFNTILILIISLIGIGFSYLIWGITTGYLKNPDPETIGVEQMEIIISSIVIIIGGYVCHKKLKLLFRYRDVGCTSNRI